MQQQQHNAFLLEGGQDHWGYWRTYLCPAFQSTANWKLWDFYEMNLGCSTHGPLGGEGGVLDPWKKHFVGERPGFNGDNSWTAVMAEDDDRIENNATLKDWKPQALLASTLIRCKAEISGIRLWGRGSLRSNPVYFLLHCELEGPLLG